MVFNTVVRPTERSSRISSHNCRSVHGCCCHTSRSTWISKSPSDGGSFFMMRLAPCIHFTTHAVITADLTTGVVTCQARSVILRRETETGWHRQLVVGVAQQ